jgi:LmbE family N-acetylglucosaminyl deacetylase
VYKNVLLLSPHTDDGELGCGGFVSRLIREGSTVYYVAFSAAETAVPPGLANDTLRKEVAAATLTLGIHPGNLRVLEFEVRRFPERRQEILDATIRLRDDIRPDLVLMPSLGDIHQDHSIVAQEGLRACKNVTVLGYELPWNNLAFETTSFVKLTSADVERKVLALSCYRSQQFRSYFQSDFILSLARTRGTQVQCQYAEAYEVVRYVI